MKYRRGQYKRTFCPAPSAQCFIQTPKHWRGNEDCWSRDCRCRMRPEGPKIGAEDRQRESGSSRGGIKPPHTSYRGLGNTVNFPSGVIVHSVMMCDAFLLLYETKFTVRKSNVMVLTARKRRRRWGRGTRHFGRNWNSPSPNRCPDIAMLSTCLHT